jgi:hypothetical protein
MAAIELHLAGDLEKRLAEKLAPQIQSGRRHGPRRAAQGPRGHDRGCAHRGAGAASRKIGRSMELAKAFEPHGIESRWYPAWESRGYFKAGFDPAKPSFSIQLPPPNVTGTLHMGPCLPADAHGHPHALPTA